VSADKSDSCSLGGEINWREKGCNPVLLLKGTVVFGREPRLFAGVTLETCLDRSAMKISLAIYTVRG
jgi:hypothetical protein